MKKKMISLISAMAAVVAVIPEFNSVNASAITYEKIRDSIVDVDLNDTEAYDFNLDGNVDFNDYKELETKINNAYTYKNDLTKKIPYNVVTSDMKITNSEFTKLDINKDHYYSTDDYCSFLKALCSKMTVEIDYSELTAKIIKYDDPKAKTIVLPTEYYSVEDDRIYPITEIEREAFLGCKDLEEIFIDNYRQPNIKNAFGFQIENAGEVTASNPLHIQNYAFYGCGKLLKVYLPQNITIEPYAFEGTAFKNDPKYHFYRAGIEYFCDYDYSTTLAASISNEDEALMSSGTLGFLIGTTSINKNIISSRSESFRNRIINLTIPFDVKYIGEEAFKNCFNLETVNGKEYNDLSEEYKTLINKHISAFNRTNFMAKETQNKVNAIVDKVNKELEELPGTPTTKDKAIAAAKAIVDETYYTEYYTSPGNFSLYPDTLYHTLDLCRGALGSEHAALTCHYTMCGGVAAAYTLVLDCLDVKNYFVGGAEHAYNQIFDEEENKWHSIDLNLSCTYYVRATDIDKTSLGTEEEKFAAAKAKRLEEARNSVKSYIYADADYYMRRDANFTGNAAFTLFENSQNKQFTNEGHRFFFTYGDDRSKLYVYLYKKLYDNGHTDYTVYNRQDIENRMNSFDFFNQEKNYLTTVQVSFGPWSIGDYEYYIEKYEENNDNEQENKNKEGTMRGGKIKIINENGKEQTIDTGYDDWNGRKKISNN